MGANFGSALLVYPLVFIGVLALSLGASLFLCGLVVFLSDLNYLWGLFCRMLFFITPVFFLPEVAGEGMARTVIEMNPLTGLIRLARQALLYGGPVELSQAGLVPSLPVRDNVFLYASLAGLGYRETKQSLPRILEFCSLSGQEYTWVEHLSFGLQQRLFMSILLETMRLKRAEVFLVDLPDIPFLLTRKDIFCGDQAQLDQLLVCQPDQCFIL